ncbi:glycoside hydrolase family 5 protein [Microbacter margulisiae]|uniref:Endoglucanase n=1 Tax=Microbacter margulisiae TaxID=1350067 RepID=A0A7W5DUA6_9PORP|nr:glycoside hydrolase family 5 protein [Microbacter margulisiae]MBB3188724.1 endoglucanase [Microbacter margulisiae]
MNRITEKTGKYAIGSILFLSFFLWGNLWGTDAQPLSPKYFPPKNSPVTSYGQLYVHGRYLTDQHGDTIALHGQSFAWSSWWPQYWNAKVVSWLVSDWKVDIVRASMGIDVQPGYLNDSVHQVNLLEGVVDAAIREGVYVIIDWHCEAFHQAEVIRFFTKMAQRYGKYPNILYEIINEPNNTQTWPEVKAYAETVIPAIRQYDKKNIIIVGCPYWDQKIREVADSPLTGYTNIMYTVHFYAATHGQWLRDDCTYAYHKNIPIFVTECNGSEASGSGHIDYMQWDAWWNYCDSHKISWINWSISDKPHELCSALMPHASANGGWNDLQLTETGKYVRHKLRSYHNNTSTKLIKK